MHSFSAPARHPVFRFVWFLLSGPLYGQSSVIDSLEGRLREPHLPEFALEKTVSTGGTAGEKGTGLGLLLCKEFVEKNHGRIFVESQVGVGTLFTIRLPEPDGEECAVNK